MDADKMRTPGSLIKYDETIIRLIVSEDCFVHVYASDVATFYDIKNIPDLIFQDYLWIKIK
jgi:hypothetical protein